MNGGSYWRGRRMDWDPDKRAIEQERQRWVTEKLAAEGSEVLQRLADEAELLRALYVDPDKAYANWRDDYLRTGNEASLRMMLEYVR